MTSWTTPKTWDALETLTSTNMNAQVRDNLLHIKEGLALDFNHQIKTRNGSATIASGTFADVHADLNMGFFTPRSAASTLMVGLSAIVNSSTAPGDNLSFDLNIDGTRIGDATYGSYLVSAQGTARVNIHLLWFITLSAVSHAIKPQWRRDGGTTWTLLSTNGNTAKFYVVELGPIIA